MSGRRVVIDIDRVVVDGVDPADRAAVRATLDAALRRRLAEAPHGEIAPGTAADLVTTLPSQSGGAVTGVDLGRHAGEAIARAVTRGERR